MGKYKEKSISLKMPTGVRPMSSRALSGWATPGVCNEKKREKTTGKG